MWCTQPGSVGVRRRVGRALLVGEDGDQAPVARVEVEVALRLVVEVRLLEHERHAEHALPEVDRRLPVGPDDRDVVDALALKLSHQPPPAVLDELRLVLAALQAPPRHELDAASGRRARCATRSRIASASAASAAAPGASSTLTGSGGSCFTPGARGRTRMWPLTPGANALTTSRTADGKTLTPRTISMSSVRPMQRTRGPVRPQRHGLDPDLDVVARAEAQQRRRAMPEMRQHELAGGAVVQLDAPRPSPGRSARRGRSRARRGACRPAPRTRPRATTPMSPMPIASVTLAPQPSSSFARKAGSPPPGSPATSTRSTLEPAQVDVALGRPLDEVGGVGGRQHRGLGPEQLDRAASGARCCRCRPGCGRGRCGRTRRAPRRPRTARRCRSRRCAGRRRRRRRA